MTPSNAHTNERKLASIMEYTALKFSGGDRIATCSCCRSHPVKTLIMGCWCNSPLRHSPLRSLTGCEERNNNVHLYNFTAFGAAQVQGVTRSRSRG